MRAKWVFGLATIVALGAMTIASAQQRPDGPPGGRGPGPGGPGGFGGRGGGGGMFFGGRGGGASRMGLLQMTEIRKELELADEQVAEIEKLQDELRAKYPSPFGGRGGPGGPGGPGGEGDRGRRGRGPGGDQGTLNVPAQWYFVQTQDPNQGQGRRGGFNFGQPPSAEDRARFEQQQQDRAREEKARLAEILLPEQMKRLNEIFVQVAGISALQDEDIAKELGVSEAQKTKISEVRQQNRESFGAAMRDGGGDPEANRAKMEELTKANDAKLLAVLSSDQQKKFEELKGKPFQMPEGFGRGGFGGPGGPGGPGGFRGRGNRGGNNN